MTATSDTAATPTSSGFKASADAGERSPNVTTLTLDVGGMKCAGCVRAVENQLTHCDGVMNATVNLVTEVATVDCLDSVDPQHLAETLTDFGFPTQPRLPQSASDQDSGLTPAERHQQETRTQMQRLAIAGVLLVLSTLGHLDHVGWVSIPLLSNIVFHFGLATLALIGPGRSMIVDGWRGLRHNAPNMNTLVGLGTLTAYTTSLVALLFPQLGWECFFDEPVMLVGFILLGRTLEQRARTRAANALQALVSLQPTLARLVTQNDSNSNPSDHAAGLLTADYQEIPVDQVQRGTWLQVLPGDKIPVDGEVVAGHTSVNESMVTGESIPVPKQPGDPVIAGSLNQSGAIAIKATHIGSETTLAQIISLVETAQTRKAPIQKLADTVAGYFTYGIMAIATLTFLFWYGLGVRLFPDVLTSASTAGLMDHGAMVMDAALSPTSPLLLSLKLAIAVLVIACPCALGLATPTAILVGSGIGAEQGLLIRGGDVLETVHKIQTVVFDKTGTLTTGQPMVTDCCPLVDHLSDSELLQLTATVEQGTRHPLAEAIQQEARRQNLSLLAAQNFQTHPGHGISAQVDSLDHKTVWVGTADWLQQQQVAISEFPLAQARSLTATGKSVIYVAIDQNLVGVIAVQDQLRSDALDTVNQLRSLGLQIKILTGDQDPVAQAMAQALNLPQEDVLANVRPDQKAAAIAQLQANGSQVAMVGDGINDAPALAQADVGIALQSGTSVAIETAGIVLMRDRLLDVVRAIRLSQLTFNKIRQNLIWAFGYNILGIPLAAGLLLPSLHILLNPATAGALMAFSSVSVVSNSLLLRYRARTLKA